MAADTSRHSPGASPGVAFVVPWALHHAGGVNVVVKALLEGVCTGGTFEPTVVVLDWQCSSPVVNQTEWATEIHMRLRSPFNGKRFGFLRYALFLPGQILSLRKLIRSRHIRYVNIHYPQLATINFIILKMLMRNRLVVVLSFHGADLSAIDGSPTWIRQLWKRMARRSNAITACSRQMASRVEKSFDMPAGTVQVIHNGVDVEKFRRSLSVSDVPALMNDGRRWLLCIATFEYKKGQDVLLRAFERIAQANPDVALLMIGRAGPFLDEIRRLVQSLGIEDKVVIADAVSHEDIPRFYKAAEIFVLPSRDEPFGIVLLEAGLAALPVVASRVGGIPEIIEDDTLGLLVPPEDPLALSSALSRLLEEPRERESLGAALEQHVVARFSWKRCCEGYLQSMKAREMG